MAAAQGITSAQAAGAGAFIGTGNSAADTNLIPSVSVSSRISDTLTFGIGMYGTSGMGVDYRETNGLFNAQTQMQIMKFAPTLAFNSGNFGFGVSPMIQYGSLDLNYQVQMANNMGQPMFTQTDGTITTNQTTSPAMKTVGSGVSSDLGMGFTVGGFYTMGNLTLAAAYQSAINMKYEDSISVASAAFVNPMSDFTTAFSDDLEQPSELKLGVAYNAGKMTYTADYKQVAWGSAKGYKDFGWEDQNIIAVGAKYSGNGYWLGAGYNHGSNPIKEQDGNTYKGAVVNMFNNVFFPATTESHISVGGGYDVTKNVGLDFAFMMAPEVSTSVNTNGVSSAFASGMTGAQTMAMSESTTKHSQTAFSMSVRYNF
jgi:long-chain fatty acid transport protein